MQSGKGFQDVSSCRGFRKLSAGTMPEYAFHGRSRQNIPNDCTQPLARIVHKMETCMRLYEDVFEVMKRVLPRIDV